MRSPTKLWRLFRRWKPLIYFILLILLVQALIAFHTNPNLLEEEKLRLMKEAHIRRKNEMAKELFVEKLSNDEKALGETDKESDLNQKIQERFVRGAKINVLEDNDKQSLIKPKEVPVNRIIEKHSDVAFKPHCEVTHKDALSALARATTNTCKQEIADNACRSQNGTLFPKSMPRYCPHEHKYTGVAPIPASYAENASKVRICYMLVVHGRAVRQFFRLFKAIYHQDHFYYIHVDLRSDHLFREVQILTEKFKNVKIAPWRMATIWGGSSLLQMLLRAMTDVLQSWSQWDFFINLSALDFPIETQEKLVNYLTAYNDKNFMKSHGRDDEKFIRKQGLNRLFVECENHMWRLGERDLPQGITLNGGSDWVALNRDFCEYVINGDDQLLKDLKHWYKYTLLPAESFFHTLAQNSLKCETFVDNNLRVTNWNRARGCKCQYKHIVDWCGCSPNDFFPSDLARLQTSRPVFFARKFEEIINQEVVNHLDFKLYGDYPPGTPSINSFWENCYDHLDKPEVTDDAFLTHYASFARIGLSKINPPMNEDSRFEECNLSLVRVKQVEVYKHREEFKGYVVTFEAVWPNSKHSLIGERGKILLQTMIYRNPSLQILDHTSPLAKRLEHAAVGTNWDVKELVLRDWGGIIGPLSEPRLVARWRNAPDDFIVTVVLVDPLNVVADYNDFRAPNNAAGVTDTPLSIQKPLRPGKWTARFYVQRQFQRAAAVLSFIVVPLQFQNNLKHKYNLTASNRGVSDDNRLNSGQRNLYSIRTTLNLPRDWGAGKSLEERSTYIGEDLESWIDEVVDLGWTSDSVCIAGSDMNLSGITPSSCVNRFKFIPKLCKTLPWSSYFPDPKSEIGPLQHDGRIR